MASVCLDGSTISMQNLFDEIDFSKQTAFPNDTEKISILQEQIMWYIQKGNFIAVCESVEGGNRQSLLLNEGRLPHDFLVNVCHIIQLPPLQLCAFMYALTQSQYSKISEEAFKLLSSKLPEINTLSGVTEGVLNVLVGAVLNSEELASKEVSGNFMAAVKASPYNGMLTSGVKISSRSVTPAGHSRNSSIAEMLIGRGRQVSSTVDLFATALRSVGQKIDEEQLGAILGVVVFSSNRSNEEVKESSVWNLDVIADVLSVECKNLDWATVVRCIDQPNISIPNDATFQNLTNVFSRISGKPLPVEGLVGLWTNRHAQLAMLTFAATAPRSVVDFTGIFSPDFRLEGEVPGPANLSWMCLPYYKALVALACSGMSVEVLQLLNSAANAYPEYVTIGLAQVQDSSNVRAEENVRTVILRRTLPLFTGGCTGASSSSGIVMKKLAEVNPDLLVLVIRLAFKKACTVHEILDIEARRQSFGPLGRRVEEEGTADELIGFWCVLADRREDFSLEMKLRSVLEKNSQFARYLFNFAKNFAETLRPKTQDGGILSIENFSVILRCVQMHQPIVSIEEIRGLAQMVQMVHQQQLQQQHAGGTGIRPNQQLPAGARPTGGLERGMDGGMQGVPGATGAGERPPPGSEAAEIDELANAYFQKIYTSDITIPEVINLLKSFKNSAEQKEQEIFRCMIHNLFDEYRFFHKYPDRGNALSTDILIFF